jgi:cytochrome P450
LIDLNIVGTNLDEEVVGEQARQLCPERQLKGERVSPAIMSFGDGHHRCPGAYIALQETDIFLQRLLRVDGLRIAQEPTLSWSELTKGYELRNFMVTVDR